MESQADLQTRSLNEAIVRANAFEAMIRTEGWQLIKAYFENGVQLLANDLLIQEDKPIADLEGTRRELIGIRRIFTMIEEDLQTLATHRKEHKDEEPSQSTGEL